MSNKVKSLELAVECYKVDHERVTSVIKLAIDFEKYLTPEEKPVEPTTDTRNETIIELSKKLKQIQMAIHNYDIGFKRRMEKFEHTDSITLDTKNELLSCIDLLLRQVETTVES
jgi:hypothetical protein